MGHDRHKLGLHRQLPTPNSNESTPAGPPVQGRRVQRRPLQQRLLRTAVPALALSAVLGTSMAVAWPEAEPAAIDRSSAEFDHLVSRNLDARPPLEETKEAMVAPVVVGEKYTTAEKLNVRADADGESEVITALEFASEVAVTGEEDGEFAEIVYKDEARWVTAEYLADEKPEPPEPETKEKEEEEPAPDAISGAPCATSSGIEGGLQSNAIKVYRAVCANFPSVSSYGGLRPGDGGAHGSGRAVDIMVTGAVGQQIADWVRANAAKLGVSEVIWQQRIWTTQRSGDGWRSMSDRGGATANHMDHVHVTTN